MSGVEAGDDADMPQAAQSAGEFLGEVRQAVAGFSVA